MNRGGKPRSRMSDLLDGITGSDDPVSVDVGREVLPGEGGAGGDEVGRCALEDDPTAVVACAGTKVDDPVGVRHDRLMMLDDDDRCA